MIERLDPKYRIVHVSDSGTIPSLYVRFLDPIALVTDNYETVPHYREGAERIAERADLLVVQRGLSVPTRRIVADAKARGIPIVYETDDNLLNLPPGSAMQTSHTLVDNIEAVLAMADLATCSTLPLAEAIAPYIANVEVIENYGLDKPAVDVAGQPHLCIVNTDYFKLSDSKHGFFSALACALEDLEYRMTFFGSVDAEMTGLRDRFPDSVTIVDDFVDGRSAFLDRLAAHGVNVAAAPLDDSEHHLVKSDIKFLDFASLGVPAIFNNPRVYGRVRHQVDGYLTADTQVGWFEALRYFADADHRRDCGAAARAIVATTRGIDDYAAHLAAAYTRLLGKERRAAAPPIDPDRSGMFWQSSDLYLLHAGVKRHVGDRLVVAALIERGFGLLEPRIEEYMLAPAASLSDPRHVRGLAPPRQRPA